jgi:divalent metal cation (Fe/Co/Zn/Cd) transporter
MDTIDGRGASVRSGIGIEWISTGWTIIEAAAALLAGVMAHSVALIAFGADSIIELVSGCALLWRLYVEASHADYKRVEKAEHTASWIVGIGLIVLAFYIVVASVRSLLLHEGPDTAPLGIAVTTASSILMPLIAAGKKRIGRRIGSRALESDGSCSMVCAFMSWIVLGGVLLTALLGWWWIDAVAAFGLVYFVVHEGLEAIENARNADSRKPADD